MPYTWSGGLIFLKMARGYAKNTLDTRKYPIFSLNYISVFGAAHMYDNHDGNVPVTSYTCPVAFLPHEEGGCTAVHLRNGRRKRHARATTNRLTLTHI